MRSNIFNPTTSILALTLALFSCKKESNCPKNKSLIHKSESINSVPGGEDEEKNIKKIKVKNQNGQPQINAIVVLSNAAYIFTSTTNVLGEAEFYLPNNHYLYEVWINEILTSQGSIEITNNQMLYVINL